MPKEHSTASFQDEIISNKMLMNFPLGYKNLNYLIIPIHKNTVIHPDWLNS